jgi:hypothetical protein
MDSKGRNMKRKSWMYTFFMARPLRVFLFAAGLFLTGAFAFSQEVPPDLESDAFFVQGSGGEARLIQRLSWPGDENAFYEVVVESLEDGVYREILREPVELPFLDVSLGPGSYRYQVLFYNLLKQFEYATNWASFNIILALQPELTSFSPGIFYLNEDTLWEVRIQGRNLVKGAKVYLRFQDGQGAAGPAPRSYTPDEAGESALLVFNPADLSLGRYEVYVENPGGLNDSAGPFEVVFAKPFDLNVQVGYAPLFPLYGYLSKELFDKPIYPAGALLRVSYIPFKRTWGYLGPELSASWGYLDTEKNNANIKGHLWSVHANALYKKLLPNRIMSFNARAGLGISSFSGLIFTFGGIESDPISTWMISLDTGLSFRWYVRKPFYLDLGTDYIHILSRDSPQPGFLTVSLEAGWQF